MDWEYQYSKMREWAGKLVDGYEKALGEVEALTAERDELKAQLEAVRPDQELTEALWIFLEAASQHAQVNGRGDIPPLLLLAMDNLFAAAERDIARRERAPLSSDGGNE